ncbi:MAG: Cof-type HAD-IIB family hydrolase [Lachnospiraceae bacterium]|nr:Cof-type HAD-IIB family hydrolase [Lachnospiraceae bacterium]
MDKKVLVLDLDGTLTNSNKEITPDTKEAIMKIQKMGHTVVLASGRPTPGVEPLAEELKLDKFGGYILSYNGGMIKECKTGEVVYQQTLPKEIVPKLFDMADELNIGLASYDSDGIVANDNRNKYIELESRINKLPIQYRKDVAEYIDFPVNKCLGTADPEIAPKKEEAIKEKFGDVLNVSRSEPFFIEITPKGIDKAASLEKFCEITGNKRENMIACGDGFNDISMIEYAGIGVAMANAQPEVKEVADFITTSNDEDGVARVIEEFII